MEFDRVCFVPADKLEPDELGDLVVDEEEDEEEGKEEEEVEEKDEWGGEIPF